MNEVWVWIHGSPILVNPVVCSQGGLLNTSHVPAVFLLKMLFVPLCSILSLAPALCGRKRGLGTLTLAWG